MRLFRGGLVQRLHPRSRSPLLVSTFGADHAGSRLTSILDLVKADFFLDFLPTMIFGFVIAGIIGYLSIRWLLGYLKKNSLFAFALYCALLSIVTVFVAAFR